MGEELTAELIDLGPNGLGLMLPLAPEPGTLIEVLDEGWQLPRRGQVMWSLHQADGLYRVGVGFLPPDGEQP